MRKHLITVALCMALANLSQAREINTTSDSNQTLKPFKIHTSGFFPPELMIGKLVHKGDKRA